MESLKQASALITFNRRFFKLKTNKAWIEWRECVISIYSDTVQEGSINASINSGAIAGKRIKADHGIAELCAGISSEQKTEVLSLLFLYKLIEEKNLQFIPGSFDFPAWEENLNLIGGTAIEIAYSETRAAEWLEKQSGNKFRTTVEIPATLWVVCLEYLTRWVVLICFKYNSPVFSNQEQAWYATIQVIFIPVCAILLAIFRDRFIVKNSSGIVAKLNVSNIRFKIRNSAWNYLLIGFFVISGSYILFVISNPEYSLNGAILCTLAGIAYGIYLLVLLTNFSKSRPAYGSIVEQLKNKQQKELSGNLSADENDEEIIHMGVSLKAQNERMNAYVIEAALFGALAFSGFLQIISAGEFTTNMISDFNAALLKLLAGFVNLNSTGFNEFFSVILSKSGLMALLCYQTLICSICFLSVIASRLRFSNLSDIVDRAMQLSIAYNEKEENLIHQKMLSEDHAQVKKFNYKIKEQLIIGYARQDEIAPIMEFMKFFRTLGITTFFIIIVTGGLLVSVQLSFILLFISLLSTVYFKLGNVRLVFKTLYIRIQEFYFRIEKYVNWTCWSMICIGIILKSFDLKLGLVIMTLGFLFLFFHLMLSLVVPVQLESFDSGKDDAFGSGKKFQILLANVFTVALAVFFLGFVLKLQHGSFAGPLLITGLASLSFYFLFTKKVPAGPKWLASLLSFSLCLGFMSVLFKIQHFPNSEILGIVSTLVLFVSLVAAYFNRTKVLPLIQRTNVILLIVVGCFNFNFTGFVVRNLSLNYSQYAKAIKIAAINTAVFNYRKDGGYADAQTPSEVDSLGAALKQFNEMFVDIPRPDANSLNSSAWDVFQQYTDSLHTNAAVGWSKRSLEINRTWEFMDTYANLLHRVGRDSEALPEAREAYRLGHDPGTKKLLNDIEMNLKDSVPLEN